MSHQYIREIMKEVINGNYDFSTENLLEFITIEKLKSEAKRNPADKYNTMLLLMKIAYDRTLREDISIKACLGDINKHILLLNHFEQIGNTYLNFSDLGFQIKDVVRIQNIVSISKDSILDIQFKLTQSLSIFIKTTDIDYLFTFELN